MQGIIRNFGGDISLGTSIWRIENKMGDSSMMNLREMGYEDRRQIELAQNLAQWRVLLSSVLRDGVLLSESHLKIHNVKIDVHMIINGAS
jgi:hypothetical protein